MRRLLFVLLLINSIAIQADVIKPALIEISAYSDGKVEVEIRASIEAILTGINSAYKNTTQAPQAAKYDELRVLPSSELELLFKEYEAQFLSSTWLKTEQTKLNLVVEKISIPEAGYTQVPRISTILLSTQIPSSAQSLQWFYPAKYSDNAVRLKQSNLSAEQWHWGTWQWIRNNQASDAFSLSVTRATESVFTTAKKFIVIGFTHILPKGADHLLFVLGLFLLSKQWRPLLWQVTAFTLAHSVTLALATLGIVQFSARITEPLIALSIAAIGLDNLLRPRLSQSRVWIVFGFGLLHGLGFASVLTDFNLPNVAFFTPLLSFNIGVELAQLSSLLIIWACIGWWIKEPYYRKWVVIPLSVLISLIAVIWAIQRI